MIDEDGATAVHEAGHAIARFLTAAEMGLEPEKAVSRIEFQPGLDPRPYGDTSFFTVRMATTFGPLFSSDIQAHIGRVAFGHHVSPAEQATAIFAARAAGIDVLGWCRSRMLMHVFGAVAEARYASRGPNEIWTSAVCHSDLEEALEEGALVGWSPERTLEAIDAAIDEAVRLVNVPAVWSAIDAVAKEIRRLGTLTGPQALQAIPRGGADIGLVRRPG